MKIRKKLMNSVFSTACLVAAICLFFCFASADASPKISKVGLQPGVINVLQSERAEISFHLNEAAQVTINILDPDGWPVKTLMQGQMLEAGYRHVGWDGTQDNGELVPDEAYSIYIKARNESGVDVFNPSADSGGMAVLVYPEIENESWPLRASFSLRRPLRVQVRMGIDKGPLLHIPVDWQALEPGSHTVSWNGRTTEGRRLTENPENLKVLIDAYTLPDIVVLTRGNPKDFALYKFQQAKMSGVWDNLMDMGMNMDMRPSPAGFHNHADRTRIEDREPGFDMSVGINEQSREKILQVDVSLDEITEWVMAQRRFEIKLYVNGELIVEEEQGMAPYSFYTDWNDAWDAYDDLLITVNVATLYDQVGGSSRILNIGP